MLFFPYFYWRKHASKSFHTKIVPFTLTTEHLILRCLELDDALDVFAYASDPEVSRFTQWEHHASLDDTYAFIASTAAYMHLKQNIIWGIEHKKEKKIIGECGFVHIAHPQAELYYALAKEHWGKGFATEALSALIAFGFQEIQLERFEAWIIAGNIGSHKVAQKVGMKCETILYNHWYAQENLYDIYIYSTEKKLSKSSNLDTYHYPSTQSQTLITRQ